MYFKYLNPKDRHWIGIRLGNYVSHKLIYNDEELLDTININQIDRVRAAKEWYETEAYYNKNKITGFLYEYGIFLEQIYEDAAKWIDRQIPKAYQKNLFHDGDHAPGAQYVETDEFGNNNYGLIYHYSQNEVINNTNNDKITEKQLKYLKFLSIKCNYIMINSSCSKKEASELINYFSNIDSQAEPNFFYKYFTKGI